ncbi:MAG: hypothetical protein FJW39_14465 [Acidobacteria bacterium]|nr:hypothetical protein [Acidobacteriota bacterium]
MVAEFLDSTDPRILMQMPGCFPVADNFANSFPRVVDSPSASIRSAARVFDGVGVQHSARCYCETIHAIIALVERHCVFDSMFAGTPKDDRQWRVGLEFVLNRQYAGVRTYSVWRVFGRLASAEHLEVRLRQVRGLEVRVETLSGMHPVLLRITASFGGWQLLKQDECLLDPQGEYQTADHSLGQALGLLETSSVTVVRDYLAQTRQFGDCVPFRDLVDGLFRDNPAKSELLERIAALRSRLWDANAVVDKFRPELEKTLSSVPPGFASDLVRLQLEQESSAEIAKLEGADRVRFGVVSGNSYERTALVRLKESFGITDQELAEPLRASAADIERWLKGESEIPDRQKEILGQASYGANWFMTKFRKSALPSVLRKPVKFLEEGRETTPFEMLKQGRFWVAAQRYQEQFDQLA